MRTSRHPAVLLVFLVSASSASSGEDDLSGCYSLDPDHEPLLKIEKIESTYGVSLRDKDGWKEAESLHPGTQQEISEVFENDSAKIKSSLLADMGPFALFHVQAGETYSGFKAKTDYITYIFVGVSSAYKKACINPE